jgi:hypothetical protein
MINVACDGQCGRRGAGPDEAACRDSAEDDADADGERKNSIDLGGICADRSLFRIREGKQDVADRFPGSVGDDSIDASRCQSLGVRGGKQQGSEENRAGYGAGGEDTRKGLHLN